MQLFYTPSNASPGTIVTLSEEESWHCSRVLRGAEGDHLNLTDGMGKLFRGTLTAVSAKRCELVIDELISGQPRPSWAIHIAIAPTKSPDRFEWFLEKATEIGITTITPLICERSERTSLKRERLEKILVAAMKQSLNLWLPSLGNPAKFKDFISKDHAGQRFIGYCGEVANQPLEDLYIQGHQATIMIGPEGDFTENEVNSATGKGYLPVSLGPSRLRTETAGIVATHIINLLNHRQANL